MTEKYAKALILDLRSQGDSEQAKMVARYMKTSTLQFLGVKLPNIRRTALRHIQGIPVEDLAPLVHFLWEERTFDVRMAAIQIMEKYTLKGDIKVALQMIDEMIDDIDTWGLSDPLCIVCLGTLLLRDFSVEETISSWRTDDNFWRRRASVLPYHHLSKKRFYAKENAHRVLEGVKPHISDKEFFVGKAAGWVLRELSKREPGLVQDFIAKHRNAMTPLVVREGSKKLK